MNHQTSNILGMKARAKRAFMPGASMPLDVRRTLVARRSMASGLRAVVAALHALMPHRLGVLTPAGISIIAQVAGRTRHARQISMQRRSVDRGARRRRMAGMA